MRMLVSYRSREDDEIGAAARSRVVAASIRRSRAQCGCDDLPPIDRRNLDRDPSPPYRERNRGPNEPEAHDRDASKRPVVCLCFVVRGHRSVAVRHFSLRLGPHPHAFSLAGFPLSVVRCPFSLVPFPF